MTGQFELDGKVFNLKLGRSFQNDGEVAYHSIRYDFKPASVDVSKDATLEIDERNSVTVTVPHVEGSGMSHTIFKGNKKPSQKECVLIINHDTNEVFLEKLSNSVQVKSTRRSMKGVNNVKQRLENSGQSAALPSSQPEKSKMAAVQPKLEPMVEARPVHNRICENLSASSTSESGMSDDSEVDEPGEEIEQGLVSNDNTSQQTYDDGLRNDLQLSDSDSD